MSTLTAVGQELNVARRNCCLSSVAVALRCLRCVASACLCVPCRSRRSRSARRSSQRAHPTVFQRMAPSAPQQHPNPLQRFRFGVVALASSCMHAHASACALAHSGAGGWASVSVTAAVRLPRCPQRAVRQAMLQCCAALRCNTFGRLAWQAVAQRSGALHVCGESADIRDGSALGSPAPHLHRDLGSPAPHLHRDWAHPRHICTGTDWAHPRHICTLHRGLGPVL
jgi:hypothetical protein